MITVFPPILKYRAATHPERIAYLFEGTAYTYQNYYSQASQAATYLQSLGLKKGDRIGILDLNNNHVVNLVTGALLIGVIPVSVNWRAMPQDLLFVISDADIEHFFYGAAFSKLIAATPLSDRVKLRQLEKIVDHSGSLKKTDTDNTPFADDICAILYTSGTTGNPKGVMLTYTNLFSCYHLCVSDTPAFGPDSRNLVCGPLYSIFGFGSFFAGIYSGATNVLLKMFDPVQICSSITNDKVTHAVLIPIMFRLILSIPGVEEMDFSSLRHIQYGGSPVSGPVLQKISTIFKCEFTQVYGLTETSGVATALRFDDHRKILGSEDINTNILLLSAGKPGLGVEIKILDEDGNAVSENIPGEIFIKGEIVTKGYWKKPEISEKVFNNNGWFSTGDIGYLNEDGYLFLVDRKNDMIVSKGSNIYPAEIEKIIELYPGFKEVAVIGIPDDKAGEAICAVAVLKNGAVELEHLQEWCIGKIAEHKIPKRLEITTELPRNATGKVLRRLIRDPFWVNEQRKIKG